MVRRRIWLFPILFILPMVMTTAVEANITEGIASYYADRFNGRLTASGSRFDMQAMTAAHRTLKFGTRVMVTNKANGRSVEVTINDRGPYVAGRSIDLSKGAARKIGMLGSGVAKVELKVLKAPKPKVRTPSGLTVAAAQKIMMDLF